MVANANDIAWVLDIFTWEHLASVLTVFGVLSAIAFVPLYNVFKKRRCDKIKHLDEQETQKIKEISTEVMKPLISKLEKQEEVQKELKDTQRENDRNTKDILSTVRSLVKEFHQYKNEQIGINTKLAWMDGYFRTNQTSALNKSYRDYERNTDDDNNHDDHVGGDR